MTSSEPSNGQPHKSLLEIIKTYIRVDLPADDENGRDVSPPAAEKSGILTFLRPIPWLLALLFAFSFYWDFSGITLTFWGFTLEFTGLFRILSVSGLIGFLTNRIAIMMLFHPLKKRPLLGHGLIPAHKDRIAVRLSHSVSSDLINPELIRKKLAQSESVSHYRKRALSSIGEGTQDEAFRRDLKLWLQSILRQLVTDPQFRSSVTEAVEDEVEQSIKNNPIDRAALKAYTLIRGRQVGDLVNEALKNLPDRISSEFEHLDIYLNKIPGLLEDSGEAIDAVITDILDKLIHRLNVKQIVEENLRAYDETKLEKLIKGVTNEHLLTIQYLGAVLGTIGGFVIWQPLFSLSVIGFLTILIFSADHLMMTFQQRYSDSN
ncbi:DUF445 family protein [Rhodohalobacter sp. 8-1]|uniref:DUF445 family protein n=1 Tax=Rhodohalobacter sp. 8-1 TaxID=3131972 RepID=UPI0030EDCF9D